MSKRVYSGNSRTTRWRLKKKVRGLDETLTPDISELATQQIGEEENEVQQQLKFHDELLSEFLGRGGKEVGSVPDQEPSNYEVLESDDDEYEDCSSDENRGFSSGSGCETSGDEEIPAFEPHCLFEEKIYSGATITVGESAIMIMSFLLHFKLSYSCMSKVIELIRCHLPSDNKVIKTVFLLRKMFSSNSTPMYKRIRCCSECGRLEPMGKQCSECGCDRFSYFISFHMEEQVRNLFRRNDFCNDLLLHHHLNKLNRESVDDVLDGSLHKKFRSVVKGVYDFTLMCYTDGIQLFNSSKVSVWPLVCIINELPYSKRFLVQNLLFAGLWCGNSKPNFHALLRPLYDFFQLCSLGLRIKVWNNEIHKIRAILLNSIADMPAKAAIMNMKNVNGYYSCPKCMVKGESASFAGGQRAFFFRYEDDVPLRTLNDSLRHAKEAEKSGKAVFGFKGVSLLSKIMPDYVNGCGIDIMHSVFGGTGGKRLMELWFSPKFKSESFSLHGHTAVVSKRLALVKPPNFLSRTPRPIESHLAYYKTAEYKNWFFYFSIPILHDVLPDGMLQNYFKLVHAMFLLNSASVSLSHIAVAEALLIDFVKGFSKIYGDRFISANVHSLLHLANHVRKLGPLFHSSCFPLESILGQMKKFVSGTTHVAVKIADMFLLLQAFPLHVGSLPLDSSAKDYADNLSAKIICTEEIDSKTFVVGPLKSVQSVSAFIYNAVDKIAEMPVSDVCKIWVFDRLYKDGVNYVAESYSIKGKHCSSFAVLNDSTFCVIETFIKVKFCHCPIICICEGEFIAIIRKCENCKSGSLPANDFINKVFVSPRVTSIAINCIADICIMVEVGSKKFCVKRVNTLELE